MTNGRSEAAGDSDRHSIWANAFKTIRQLILYGIVGVISNAIGYLTYLLLTSIGFVPEMALTLVYLVAATVAFFGNKKYTFEYEGDARRAAIKFALSYALGYLISIGLLWLLYRVLGFPHQFVVAFGIVLVAIILFLLQRFFVFRIPPQKSGSAIQPHKDEELIIVTGGSGFLGTRVLDALSDKHPIALMRKDSSTESGYFDFALVNEAQAEPSIVIHCHAVIASGITTRTKQSLHDGNVASTQELLTRFPYARHIYVSSIAIYGKNQDTLTESTPPASVTDYGISKLEGEQVFQEVPNSAIVRLPSLYGPGMKPNTLIPRYVSQALTQKRIEVWGDGSRRQNYLHVDDAARLVVAASMTDLNETFLGSDDRSYSNTELANLVRDETGATIAFERDDPTPSITIDSKQTRLMLGWRPRIPLSEGLRSYISWHKEQSSSAASEEA